MLVVARLGITIQEPVFSTVILELYFNASSFIFWITDAHNFCISSLLFSFLYPLILLTAAKKLSSCFDNLSVKICLLLSDIQATTFNHQ